MKNLKLMDGYAALVPAISRYVVAEMLGISVRTLHRWHQQGYGPPRIPKRGSVRYRQADIETWIAEHGPGNHRPSPAPRATQAAGGCDSPCSQLHESGHEGIER